jgi:hypothetical protein
MTTPPVPEISLPGGRQGYYNPYSGRYTTNRAYALRMQRGYARGMTQATARGQRAGESRRRYERVVGQTGQTPQQLFEFGFQQRYGFSYRYWRKLRRQYVDPINEVSSPGGEITPSMVTSVKSAWDAGWRDPNRPELTTWEMWVEVHLAERLAATELYVDYGDTRLGAYNFQLRSSLPPIEFWYYH